MCRPVPTPADPNDSLPGFVFDHAINSFSVLAGKSARTLRRMLRSAAIVIGWKSLIASNCVLGLNDGFTPWVPPVIMPRV